MEKVKTETTAPPAVAVDARPAAPSTVELIRMMVLDVGLPLLPYYGRLRWVTGKRPCAIPASVRTSIRLRMAIGTVPEPRLGRQAVR